MDLSLWGMIVYNHDLSRARIDRPKSKAVYEVNISEDKKNTYYWYYDRWWLSSTV